MMEECSVDPDIKAQESQQSEPAADSESSKPASSVTEARVSTPLAHEISASSPHMKLESIRLYLMDQVSHASQLPTHDLTDLSTLRSCLNFPWGQSMEYDMYKAANIIHGYNKAGGELTGFIIVLRTEDAVKTFSGKAHVSVGAGVSVAAGIVGRAAEANLRAGDGSYAACYTYSCSKGSFVGCSLERSIVTTHTSENFCFYGSSVKVSDILLGLLPELPSAAVLYHASSNLFQKLK